MGSTFFLEDFEDGTWNLPEGISAIGHIIGNPGTFTDSVDADDGVIDGHGNGGHSMVPSFHYVNFTGPLTQVTFFQMDFDLSSMSFAPNVFGLVWTDGVPGSWLRIAVYDEHRFPLGSHRFDATMDSSHMGDTLRDRFVGFYSDVPFGYVVVGNFYRSNVRIDRFELDHIQFGLVVPEPTSLGYMLVGLIMLVILMPGRWAGPVYGNGKEWCHATGTRAKGGATLGLSHRSLGYCAL